MERVLYAEVVQAADRAAMDLGIPSLVLMERAALSVVHFLDHHRDRFDQSRVLAVCGTGNNGGDGAAIVRILRERGLDARVLLAGDRNKLSEQMRQQLSILSKLPGEAVIFADECKEEDLNRLFAGATLLADAIFGIGLKREVKGVFAEMVGRINRTSVPVIAVDMPSGVHTDTGEICGCAVKADVTVTFTCAKPGLYLFPGAACAGEVIIRPVGIAMPAEVPSDRELLCLEEKDLDGLKKRDESGNKGTFGKLLVIAGSAQISGAAWLCACAALRSGAGMVRIYTEESNRQILATLLPEALLTTYSSRQWTADGLLEAMAWADGCVVGPGLGTDETASGILQTFLDRNSGPAVLDADALNLLAKMEKMPKITFPCCMTPHVGEMSRLTGLSAGDIKAHLADAASRLASESGATVLLKDARSIVAVPDGTLWVNTSGSSALATAGSGDVLSGIAGALMIRKDPLPAPPAVTAAFIHGCCGERAAGRLSRASVLASDIIDELCGYL